MLVFLSVEDSSIKIESMEVVWVVNEFVVLVGEVIVDEMLGFLMFVVLRNGKFGRFKFFGWVVIFENWFCISVIFNFVVGGGL